MPNSNGEGCLVSCGVARCGEASCIRVEAALRASEEKYRKLFEESIDAIVVGEAETGVITDCNAAAVSLVGWEKSQLIGRHQSLLHPAELLVDGFTAGFKRPNYEGLRVETQIVTKSGEVRDVSIKSSFFWLNGKRMIQGTFRDIMERKKAEKALRESEERLRLKLDALLSPDVNVCKGDLSQILDVDAVQAMMDDLYAVTGVGFSIIDLEGNVLVGTGWRDICTRFHRVHAATLKNCLESDLELTQGLGRGEIRTYKCNNGMWDIVTPLIIGEKHVANVFSGQFFFDDEAVDREFFVSQAERYGFDKEGYLAAFEAVPRFSKQMIERLMMFYSKMSDLISQLSCSNLKLAHSLSCERESQMKLEEKAAEVKQFADHMEALAEERARQLKAVERLAAIGETAAMVGHDLRNPLTGIKNAAYYLRKKGVSISPAKAKQMLDTIDSCVQHSNKIISDLLDYSREIHLDVQACSPRTLLSEALTLLPAHPDVRILNLLWGEPCLKVDVDKIKRVFVNLLKNAVDAMPGGGAVTVSGRLMDGFLEVSFADLGGGIPEDVLPKIFSPLFTTKAQGMGFGLSICKRIVEAHGCSIKVETCLGEGSTFRVTLPVERA